MSAGPRSVRYAVISPVKNEERFIGQTIASMISQMVPPAVWIVVDDASTDDTARIVRESMKHHTWIRYLFFQGEKVRKTGSAEIHAFTYGFDAIRDLEFDFIVKLDGDLRFDENYFDHLLSRFVLNKNLGIASGVYLEETADSWEPVKMPVYHAAGASKVVRRTCFERIGGFIARRGWDTIDEIRAQATGWETMHFTDIRFFHLRKEGTGMGQLHTNVMHGEIFFRTGGSVSFFLIKVMHRMLRGKPVFLAGAAMLWGYIAALLKGEKLLVTKVEARTYRQLLRRRMRAGFKQVLPSAIVKGN